MAKGTTAKALANEAIWLRSFWQVGTVEQGKRAMDAAKHKPDSICLDFEDTVAPKDKDKARKGFPALAKELHGRGIKVFVRVNPAPATLEEDLDAAVCPELHCLFFPKSQGPQDIYQLSAALSKAEKRKGLPDGYTLVRPIVETAQGVKFAYEIAKASPRIAYMGGVAGPRNGDLGSSFRFIPTATGVEHFHIRARVLVDVRAAGVPYPISGGYTTDRSAAGIRAGAIETRAMGYQGSHVWGGAEALGIVHEVFTPAADEVKRWVQAIPAMELAKRAGVVMLEVDGQMEDTASLVWMKEGVALAKRVGMA